MFKLTQEIRGSGAASSVTKVESKAGVLQILCLFNSALASLRVFPSTPKGLQQ